MPTLRLATHNQGDRAVSPDSGWDVQCLTERSSAPAPKWAERHTSRVKGLAIDWNPDVLTVRKKRSAIVHPGAAGISPTRGTIWVTGRLTEAPAVKVAVVCSHRINDPGGKKRAGGPWRWMVWQAHALFDRALFKTLERLGFRVLYAGDINHRSAELDPLRRLLRGHYDAFGHSRKGVDLVGDIEPDRSTASDHGRFTATFKFKETR